MNVDRERATVATPSYKGDQTWACAGWRTDISDLTVISDALLSDSQFVGCRDRKKCFVPREAGHRVSSVRYCAYLSWRTELDKRKVKILCVRGIGYSEN